MLFLRSKEPRILFFFLLLLPALQLRFGERLGLMFQTVRESAVIDTVPSLAPTFVAMCRGLIDIFLEVMRHPAPSLFLLLFIEQVFLGVFESQPKISAIILLRKLSHLGTHHNL
jgi:hypothetical protein